MVIIDKRRSGGKDLFENLNVGEVFEHGDHIYCKMAEDAFPESGYNAFDLSAYDLGIFYPHDNVKRLIAKLEIQSMKEG